MTKDPAASESAPAKINLALHVRSRLPDGYHALETLFAFTRFGDELSATPSADWSLAVSGPMAPEAGPMADNLVMRAAAAFERATASPGRYTLRLEKRIPVAAGLGGGSADAAASLRLLNRLAGFPLSTPELERLGATLGADVPACVRGRTVLGFGRGDELEPGPGLTGLPVLLVNPRVPVPTAPVFRAWDGVDRGSLGPDWRAARNDLEAPAVALQPVIADVLAWLRALPGVSLARMSGSGATCFALFEGGMPPVDVPAGWWAEATELI